MLRIKNLVTGKILQNIYGHFIDYASKREVFVNYDNMPESRPRQDVGVGKAGSGFMTRGWIRWNSEPTTTSPVGWILYDDSDKNDLKWIPFYGELSGDFALNNSSVVKSGHIFYSVIGKQILISGNIEFKAPLNVDEDITLPFGIAPNYGVIYSIGNVTITTQDNNSVVKVKSSQIGNQHIQIAFMKY